MSHWLISILSGVIVGFSLGLTGGGGSIFAVPLLVYVVREDIHLALGTSLASVGAISLVGAVSRIYHRQADLRTGAIFAACGIVGTYAGTRLNALVKGQALLVLFALLMGFVAMNVWRRSKGGQRGPSAIAPLSRPQVLSLCLAGLGVGVASGFFGIGGGFLIVPALLFFARLDMHRAASTSLCVIAMNGLTGMVSYAVQHRPIDYPTTAAFIIGGIVGVRGGGWLAGRVSRGWLMKAFAVMVWGIALVLLVENVKKVF